MEHTNWESKYLLVAPFTLLLMSWFRFGMKFKENKLLVVLIGYPFWVYDLVFNFTFASFLWGFPEKGDWLVTDRLKRESKKPEMQHGISRFIRVVNEIDPGHV